MHVGDKTIFDYLGLGRDRCALEDRFLILGIPGMFAEICLSAGDNEHLLHAYKHSVGQLALLMQKEGTALKRMVDWMEYSRFPFAEDNLQQLAQALHGWFQTRYRDIVPVCSNCAKSPGQAEVCHLFCLCNYQLHLPMQ